LSHSLRLLLAWSALCLLSAGALLRVFDVCGSSAVGLDLWSRTEETRPLQWVALPTDLLHNSFVRDLRDSSNSRPSPRPTKSEACVSAASRCPARSNVAMSGDCLGCKLADYHLLITDELPGTELTIDPDIQKELLSVQGSGGDEQLDLTLPGRIQRGMEDPMDLMIRRAMREYLDALKKRNP